MEKLDRRRFLLKMGAGAAVAGLTGAGLAVPALADSEVHLDAQGDISLIIIAGVVIGSAPTGLAVRVIVPAGRRSRGEVQILIEQDGSLFADIPFNVGSVITTRTLDTLELAGTVVAPVISPFTDLVGRAIAISAGFAPGSLATFSQLTVTVAGSHTVIANAASGTLGLD
jgi:hypothetical protein